MSSGGDPARTSPLAVVLPRLRGVHKSGQGYRANCPNPVHERTKGSLALSVSADGRLLWHCFACGDVRAGLDAIGLSLADLYPQRVKDMTPEGRRQARAQFRRDAWGAALRVLSREANIVRYAGKMLREGEPLPDSDFARVDLAVQRIDSAREVLAR